MNLLSPRYRVRQLLNKRWIAEFKKRPWSRWMTVSARGLLGIRERYDCGDDGYDIDIWFAEKDDAIKAFSWLLVSDPELIEEPEGEPPSMTIGPLHVEHVGSRQHSYEGLDLAPEAHQDGSPYRTGPSGGMAYTF